MNSLEQKIEELKRLARQKRMEADEYHQQAQALEKQLASQMRKDKRVRSDSLTSSEDSEAAQKKEAYVKAISEELISSKDKVFDLLIIGIIFWITALICSLGWMGDSEEANKVWMIIFLVVGGFSLAK